MVGEFDFRLETNPFERFKNDYQYFQYSLTNEFVDTASSYYCQVKLEKGRLLDIWDFWKNDVQRNSDHGFREIDRRTQDRVRMSIDHIKRAAFLCFWIRRLQPIISIDASTEVSEGLTTDDVRTTQDRFMAYANELCALKVGITLAGIYERPSRNKGQIRLVSNNGTPTLTKIEESLNSTLSNWDLIRDYLMVFKYKNVSPYMVYLLFKTIFLKT